MDNEQISNIIDKNRPTVKNIPLSSGMDSVKLIINQCINWIIQENNFRVSKFLQTKGLYKKEIDLIIEKYPDSKQYFDKLKEIEEEKLIDCALKDKIRSSFAQTLLENKHNWQKKADFSNKTVIINQYQNMQKDELESKIAKLISIDSEVS